MANGFSVFDLLSIEAADSADLKLKSLAGRGGLENLITDPEINRPGLVLAGFYEDFENWHIQVFGREELAFLNHLEKEKQFEVLRNFFSMKLPCCVFTNSLTPPSDFIKEAEATKTPVLQTPLTTSEFHERVFHALSHVFAKKVSLHGVLVEVYGLGVLIIGNSGVGKSETALDLVERGHRLVADDLVRIKRAGGSELIGGSGVQTETKHLMEIRGLGIINIAALFGLKAVRDNKQIDMVIHLETWQEDKAYDRVGHDTAFYEILGVEIPLITLGVKPGRNMPILIEAATLKRRARLLELYRQAGFNTSGIAGKLFNL
jgi:HPr kinase/phosphorylase